MSKSTPTPPSQPLLENARQTAADIIERIDSLTTGFNEITEENLRRNTEEIILSKFNQWSRD